jgi:hypothetical protein
VSARKAFVLGLVVGAGVLAAAGAMPTGSGVSAVGTPARLTVVPERASTAVPPGLLADLERLDDDLRRLISDYRKGKISGHGFFDRVSKVEAAKHQLVRRHFSMPVYGDVTFDEVFRGLECLDSYLAVAKFTVLEPSGISERILKEHILELLDSGRKCKQRLEKSLAAQVTISEDDTWAHNPAIGKSRICINVRTAPAQASISATLTGPDGYNATSPKAPLHADGSAQVRSIITKAGAYTKTLVVYDAAGKQTATVTKTFTVAEPPQDGPATNPPCEKPTE